MIPIRKGSNPIKIPFPVRTTEPALSQWMREVEEMGMQLRDRIPQAPGGGTRVSSGGGYTPWRPSFKKEGDDVQCRLNLGLLDQIAADNWNTWQTIDAEAALWPTLNVTATDGKITGFDISFETSTPGEAQIQENTPPGSFKIVLGVIENQTALMTVAENLEAFAMEVFRTSKSSPAEGEEPFNRHWKWSVTKVTGGTYPYIA